MDLLWLLVIGVLGVLLDRAFRHLIEFVRPRKNVPWYTKFLDALLNLIVLLGLFISLYFFPFGLLGLAAGGQQPWQEWVYIALMLLLPFFNGAILIRVRKLLINPWAITAAIGMVISANLPIWATYWRTLKQLPWDFNIFTAIFVLCLFGFLMCVALFALTANRTPTAKHKPRYIFTKAPKFLDAIDTVKTQKRKTSFNELEQRPHEV